MQEHLRRIASMNRPKEVTQCDAKCDLQQRSWERRERKLGKQNRMTHVVVRINWDIWSDTGWKMSRGGSYVKWKGKSPHHVARLGSPLRCDLQQELGNFDIARGI